jgi:hypothetical protein
MYTSKTLRASTVVIGTRTPKIKVRRMAGL